MNRDRQEKDQLVRKFEEILPFLKNVNNFGWYIPTCDADPVYKVYPAEFGVESRAFKPFTVNVKTGWHSEVIYRDNRGVHRIREGVTPVNTKEWSDFCWRSNCTCKNNVGTTTI